MRYRLFSLLALTVATFAIGGQARSEDVTKCVSIKDDQKRLACFDEQTKTKPAPSSSASQEPLKVSDVMADAKELKGKHVLVEGFALTLGESMILYEKQGSLSGLFVDISKLPRDQRRAVFKTWGEGCEALISGRAGTVMMNPGILADQVDIK